jgi:hypothetical protein
VAEWNDVLPRIESAFAAHQIQRFSTSGAQTQRQCPIEPQIKADNWSGNARSMDRYYEGMLALLLAC